MSGRKSFSCYKAVIVLLRKYVPGFVCGFLDFVLKGAEGRVSSLVRYIYYSKKMARCGDAVYFGSMIVIRNPEGIEVGDNVSIHPYCYIDGAGGVCVGSNVSIAHNCSLVSFEHTWEDNSVPIKYNKTKSLPIVIGDDVWLGCGVRVLAGSKINCRVVVAAGSVVKGELEGGFLYAGVPARKVKPL